MLSNISRPSCLKHHLLKKVASQEFFSFLGQICKSVFLSKNVRSFCTAKFFRFSFWQKIAFYIQYIWKCSQLLTSRTLTSHSTLSYLRIYFRNTFFVIYISISVISNWWYLKVNFLGSENLLSDISSLEWTLTEISKVFCTTSLSLKAIVLNNWTLNCKLQILKREPWFGSKVIELVFISFIVDAAIYKYCFMNSLIQCSQLLISQILISESIQLYQRIKFRLISYFHPTPCGQPLLWSVWAKSSQLKMELHCAQPSVINLTSSCITSQVVPSILFLIYISTSVN